MQHDLDYILSIFQSSGRQRIDTSDSATATATTFSDPRGLSIAPAPPQVYFGRTIETQSIIDILDRDSETCVAVLGGPGMGKTTLALTALHHPSIVSRFASRRFFVAFDAAEGQSSCFGILCGAFGVPLADRRTAEKDLIHALCGHPTLLLLDNFESAWESPASRREAEDVLVFLASLQGLSILVTLRGSERPQGPSWTDPFLPPLQPLDRASAAQLFAAHSNMTLDDKDVPTILAILDNVPLAVTLMSNIAQYEHPSELLRRWESMKTAMLIRGHGDHRLSSVDVSIALSLASPRIIAVPEAVTVLGLLSILPQGTFDSDFDLWASHVSSHRRSLSALLQTALVYRSSDSRICVLAPIREYMLTWHPPTVSAITPLYEHYFALASLIRHGGIRRSSAEAVAAISPEVGNIYFVIHYSLGHSTTFRPALEAAICMFHLKRSTGVGHTDLLPQALAILDDLAADLLFEWGTYAQRGFVSGDPKNLLSEALELYERVGNVGGIIDAAIMLTEYEPPEGAIAACLKLSLIAESIFDDRRLAHCQHRLAYAYQRVGNLADARSACQKAIDISRPFGSCEYRRLGPLLIQIADLCVDSGDLVLGMAHFREAITTLEAVSYSANLTRARRMFAPVLLMQGRTRETIDNLLLAKREAQSVGHAVGVAESLRLLVTAYLAASDERSAVAAALELEEVMSAPRGEGGLAFGLAAKGELALWQGDLPNAAAALQSAITAARMAHHRLDAQGLLVEEARILLVLGQVEQALGEVKGARRCFLVAALVFRKLSIQIETVPAIVRFAQALDAEDDDVMSTILDATMPPLKRYKFRPMLAGTLLSSASLALRRREVQQARQHVEGALLYFKEMETGRGISSAQSLLRQIELMVL